MRPHVDQVGLDLDPAEVAVVERVREEQQLAFRVDDRPPDLGCVRRPSQVRPLVGEIRVAKARGPENLFVGDAAHGEHRPRVLGRRLDPLDPFRRRTRPGGGASRVAGGPHVLGAQWFNCSQQVIRRRHVRTLYDCPLCAVPVLYQCLLGAGPIVLGTCRPDICRRSGRDRV